MREWFSGKEQYQPLKALGPLHWKLHIPVDGAYWYVVFKSVGR